MTYYRQGEIEPIAPIKIFQATNIGDAFRYMQKGQHIGKIVIQMPENLQSIPVSQVKRTLALSSDKSYLLVGGLGGLGRAVANWMVEHGARHFTFLSRSAGVSNQDQGFFEELRVQGCTVTAVRGSVACVEDIERAVSSSPRRIGGAIQMSMVLRVSHTYCFRGKGADCC